MRFKEFTNIDSLRHAKVDEKPVKFFNGDYKELDISPPPLCPGDASCNNVDQPFADTGSNVGRLIILLGSLLMMAGGFILSRGYRF